MVGQKLFNGGQAMVACKMLHMEKGNAVLCWMVGREMWKGSLCKEIRRMKMVKRLHNNVF